MVDYFKKQAFEGRNNTFYCLFFLQNPLLTLIKRKRASWSCLCFIHSCNSFIQDLRREESEETEDQREEVALGEDAKKEEEKKTLSVRVTIIRLIYHCMTKCHLQCFLISPPFSSLWSLFSPHHYSTALVSQGMWLMVVD